MSILSSYDIQDWCPTLADEIKQKMINELEQGHVLYFPKLAFPIETQLKHLIDPKYLAKGTKNVSYNPATNMIKGVNSEEVDSVKIMNFMRDFSDKSKQLVHSLFPHYQSALRTGRTSFRPSEIEGRQSSYRKDDTRLHVDAFPSTPVHGDRILRIFSNINPSNKSRRWNLGEPFDQVMKRFVPSIRRPIPGAHATLNLLGITKQKRTIYDHYMLNIHNTMKADEDYQSNVAKEAMDFPPNTTWIVFTDCVSHAALSGQHLLEQTFYLPVEAQYSPALAPLKQLESYLQQDLLR